jgi:hypothetical protein
LVFLFGRVKGNARAASSHGGKSLSNIEFQIAVEELDTAK